MQAQQRWLVLAIISSAVFLIVVDMTVLYTALLLVASARVWLGGSGRAEYAEAPEA